VFSVPEDQVDQLKAQAAQPAAFKVRLWGAGGALLDARVREIAASADPTTRTFLVKADVVNLGAGAGAAAAASGAANTVVRLGQTATVTMQLPATNGLAKLPLSALKEDGGRTVVWVVDPATMTVHTQAVQLGAADSNDAVVTGGLKPGTVVVSAGVHVLTAGQKVTFYRDPNAAAVPAVPAVALPSTLAASGASAR
jgi:membrane fusion protein, multidrug efflux system